MANYLLLGKASCWLSCEGRVSVKRDETFAYCDGCGRAYKRADVEARPDFVTGEQLRQQFLERALAMPDLPTGMLAVACAHPPGCYGKCLAEDEPKDD